MADTATLPSIAEHGASRLPSVELDSYNIELKDDEGFIGDRASKGAFREIIENWRKSVRKAGDDPFGDEPSDEISKKTLDTLLAKGDAEAADIVQGAIEEFSQELALVIRRYLKTKGWKDTERIVVGGGFRASRVGELVIGRTAVILKAEKVPIELVPVRNDPDEAGLIGAAHLAPKWLFKGHDAILAVDIGGTNIRAGVVELNLKKAADLSKAGVWKFDLWRHGDEKKIDREGAVKKLVGMLDDLIDKAKKEGLTLAPFIGIGCPGIITKDGAIDRGAQNLPGNWESSKFHLPSAIHDGHPQDRRRRHGDRDAQRRRGAGPERGALHEGRRTLGRADHRNGLGNARFTNRKDE